MKTKIRMFRIIGTMFFAATVLAGFTACETDTVEQTGGKLPNKETITTVSGMLKSNASIGNEVDILLTQGIGFASSDFYFEQTQPTTSSITLALRVDESLIDSYNSLNNDVERILLPENCYEFPDGQTLELTNGEQRTDIKRIRILAENLQTGEYVLPITVANEGITNDSQTLFYKVTVREPYNGPYALYEGDDQFFVFYINTDVYQPLLVQDYIISKITYRGQTTAWYNTVGNIINLRTVTLKYDKSTGQALLDLGPNMTYVLSHASKYIWPLQEEGRKVCISLEGGGTGLGFCNMTDIQISNFAAQAKAVVETYGLDGINLWDRNAGYGKEGMPETNTTSYPKLVKAMREALGPDKLLTLTVYEESTTTFWDTEATGGIAVGEYLDYAWSGYNDHTDYVQLLDPWHPDESYVSEYTQKPIAGLDPSKFGCVNFPFYPTAKTPEEVAMYDPAFLMDWVNAGYKPNNIVVFADLRTRLQDEYETAWDQNMCFCCQYLDPESYNYIGLSRGYRYMFDQSYLNYFPEEGKSGYGKWLKDW